MQTVQQPNEVTVSPYDLAVPSRASHFIIAMLEEKKPLFLRDSIDSDKLFCSSRYPASCHASCQATSAEICYRAIGRISEAACAVIVRFGAVPVIARPVWVPYRRI